MNRSHKEEALETWYDIKFDDEKFEAARKASIECIEKLLKVDELFKKASYIENGTVYAYTYNPEKKLEHIYNVINNRCDDLYQPESDIISVTSGVSLNDMRPATAEEKASVRKHIEEISTPTGININDLYKARDQKKVVAVLDSLPSCVQTEFVSDDDGELNERRDDHFRIGDIVERFKEVDEYFNHEPWTLKQILANLNILMSVEDVERTLKFPAIEGADAEMLVDGTWIRGRIVKGYRFDDGIVTIETPDGKRYWCGQERRDCYREVKE